MIMTYLKVIHVVSIITGIWSVLALIGVVWQKKMEVSSALVADTV